ncbi:MAG: molybdenum cofactor biosynthesis protein MoeB, partial [Omnitrophica WOR_2 bacterium RIFCSPHIGHO2_02_FULL_63_39]
MTTLTRDQILRYSRHLIIPEIGVEGQEKLVQAKVLLVGAGGLGSPLGLYLAAAGVGRLGIVDFDTVDFTNLQRQIIHRTEDVGRLKVESAKERINQINPDVQVTTYSTRLTRENILDILKDYDLVIDGTDNFQTRYLVNDACVFQKKPNVYGSIFRFEGQATVFYPFKGPCYRCLFPEPPPPGMVPSCAEGGVLGVLPGIIGTIQATEGIKLITGQGEPLIGRLLLFNALKMQFRSVAIKRDPDCPVCGDKPTIKELIDYEQFCGLTRGEEGQGETTSYDIEPEEAKALLARDKNAVLLDVREPHEYDIVRIEGAKLIPLGELHLRVNE